MAAMTIQTVRMKPAESNKQRQILSDETEGQGEDQDRSKRPIFNFLNNTESVAK
jgi:hypothetical protein